MSELQGPHPGWLGLTLGTQLLRVLVYQRFSPSSDRLHDTHIVLGLCSEASDDPVLDDWGTIGVDDACKDGRSMAALRVSDRSGESDRYTHVALATPPCAQMSFAILCRLVA
jgi:hypothetical protein